jgi:hypothetical protein
MNKIIDIHLGGITFRLDEPAYIALVAYLEALGKHLEQTESREEVLADIEARIAEIFHARLEGQRTVLGMADVTFAREALGGHAAAVPVSSSVVSGWRRPNPLRSVLRSLPLFLRRCGLDSGGVFVDVSLLGHGFGAVLHPLGHHAEGGIGGGPVGDAGRAGHF